MDDFIPQSGGVLKEHHEETDLSVRGIALFGITLVLLGLLTFLGVRVFISDVPFVSLGWLEKQLNPQPQLTPAENQLQVERSRAATAAEAKAQQEGAARAPESYGRGEMEAHLQRTFPTPRLQYDETFDMQLFRDSEDKHLASTGKNTEGEIFIPVDRAKELLVQRGLPATSGPFLPPTLPTAVPLVPAAPAHPVLGQGRVEGSSRKK